jgi:hypothetical protein
VHAASAVATGDVLSFTVPAGQNALLTSAGWTIAAGGTPTVGLTLVRGGVTFLVNVITVNQTQVMNLPLTSGDTVNMHVYVGAAATTIDAFLGISGGSSSGSVTLSFAGPAVLNQGLNIYPGNQPLVLTGDHIGQAFREDIRGIADTAGQQVNVIDISEIDCPCQVG